jgi:predicted AlkP superfamily pyrophosphatase or phosphodiesterase
MHFSKSLSLSFFSSLLIVLAGSIFATAEDQNGNHAKHVLLISIDGMHALDLSTYVAAHPNSTLAQLSGHGKTYTNAATSQPSDSFPGLAALVTGGSPTTTGFWYDVSYNRKLSPPAATNPILGPTGGANLCPGTIDRGGIR